MIDHLTILADEAAKRIESGYYSSVPIVNRRHYSLREAIEHCAGKNPVISEIKFASPSLGRIRLSDSSTRIANEMIAGGACALSVLTASGSFGGEPSHLAEVSSAVRLPILMKDIIVSPVQLEAASKMRADAVVLIAEVYADGLSEHSLTQMRREAGRLGLEVLLETSLPDEFSKLAEHKPDLYGVNNRDLSTLKVNLETTIDVLTNNKPDDGLLVSESGIEKPDDIRRLRSAGADAFLVGTSIMKSDNIERKVRELVNA